MDIKILSRFRKPSVTITEICGFDFITFYLPKYPD